MTASENVETVRRLYELMAARDWAATVEFYDPDFVLTRSGDWFTDLAGEYHGLEEAWTAIQHWLRSWEDVKDVPQRFVDLDRDRVLVVVKQIATGKGSGAPVEHEGGFIYTFRGRKIVRVDGYWDSADALRAAGVEEEG